MAFFPTKVSANQSIASYKLRKVVGSRQLINWTEYLGGGELGDGLGTLGDGVLGELTGEHEADGGLDLPGGEGGLLVVGGQLARLAGDALEDVVDERVHDRHALLGDARVGVHLLEHAVDVRRVRLGAGLLLLAAGGLLGRLGGFLRGSLGHGGDASVFGFAEDLQPRRRPPRFRGGSAPEKVRFRGRRAGRGRIQHSDWPVDVSGVLGASELQFWARFGSAQVRASGRVCGNIANASPIGDLAPCFLALGGEIMMNRAGHQRRLTLQEFFIDYGQQNRQPGEFVEAVILPRLQADQKLFAYKLSKRFDQDISAVLMAACLNVQDAEITDIKLGFGGMAAIPMRAAQLESFLVGKKMVVFDNLQPAEQDALRQNIARCLEADFDPIDDMRASRAYRLLAAAQLIEKLFLEYSDGKIRLSDPQRFRAPDDFTAARPQ